MATSRRLPTLPLLALAGLVALLLSGCGSSGGGGATGKAAAGSGGGAGEVGAPSSGGAEMGSSARSAETATSHGNGPAARPASAAHAPLSPAAARLREAVLRGAARDFAQGTGIGGPRFESCLLSRLRGALDGPTLTWLVGVRRRPDGQAYAAQALNRLAAPFAARCGHRFYVPELVQAAGGLSGGGLRGAAARKLGVTYGPYLGVRCRRVNRIGCGRVGIDVVLARPATAVTALIGGRRLRLRTPGMHSGVRHNDWVGTLSGARVGRPGSSFRPPRHGHARGFWAGYPPIYVAVGLRVRDADGSRTAARFPHVFLSPGWG